MSSRTRGPGALRRRLGFDGNPLRPTSDRVHALVRVALAVALVACAWVGVDAGASAYDRADTHTDQRRAYPVTADILHQPRTGVSSDGMSAEVPTRVGWHDRHGERHVATVDLTATTMQTTRLWVDDQGGVSTSPPQRTGPFTAAVGVATTTALQLAVAPVVAYVAFRYGLRRVRRAACEREWSAVEPQWRRQLL